MKFSVLSVSSGVKRPPALFSLCFWLSVVDEQRFLRDMQPVESVAHSLAQGCQQASP